MTRLLGRVIIFTIAGFLASFVGGTAQALPLDCSASTAAANPCYPELASYAGAIWTINDTQAAGSGVLDPFVRISSNDPIEDGHNSTGRPLLNDENTSPTFTHDLTVATMLNSVRNIDGVNYYEFVLDINQSGSAPFLSLDGLKICTSGSGGLLWSSPNFCTGATLVYNLDAGANNSVLLQYNNPVVVSPGSGAADLLVYIPQSLIGTNPSTFIYLWSQFGATGGIWVNNDGYEEWARRNLAAPIPEPASMLLLGTGMLGVAGLAKRRRNAKK